MLEVHKSALDKINVAYHDFLIRYQAGRRSVYAFIEGKEDLMFYRGFIQNLIPSEWHAEIIVAGSKSKVIELEGVFDWVRFSRKQVCFFLDRDLSIFFDEHVPCQENIYVTDGYSIENDIVNFYLVKCILTDLFNISDLNFSELNLIESRFENSFSIFKQEMTILMSQIILWQKEKRTVYLDNVNLKDFFIIKEGVLSLKNDFNSKLSILNKLSDELDLPISSLDDVSVIEEYFREIGGCEKFVRGKYVLWFFVEFVLSIRNDIGKIIDRYSQRVPKSSVSFGQANAMIFVGPRAKCPDSLRGFILRNFLEYTGNFNDLIDGQLRPVG